MEDTTLLDQPGVELDAEIAQRILDEGDGYSKQTAEIAQFIQNNKERFRERLISEKLIQVADSELTGFDLAAVDGASTTDPHGGGTLVVTAAYKSTVNEERQRGTAQIKLVPNNTELGAFATLMRLHLEMLLLARDKLDSDRLVILDHSFWGVMQAVSRALAAYKQQRQTLIAAKRNPDSDAMHLAWSDLFRDCLGNEGAFLNMIRNKQAISLSKTGMSQYLGKTLFGDFETTDPNMHVLGSSLNDRALLRHILQPGEFTTPKSLYHVEQEGSDIKSWKRSRFATHFDKEDGKDPFETRNQVFDEYGLPRDDGKEIAGRRLFVTYYFPHNWSRVYRIEFHELLLSSQNAPADFSGKGERFQRVLASIRQSTNPETKEPLCQVLADIRAKAAVSSSTSMLPERSFYQLRDKYRNNSEMLDIIDTLLAEERT